MKRVPALVLACLLVTASAIEAAADRYISFQARLTEAQSLYRAALGAHRSGRDAERDENLRRLEASWNDIVTSFRSDPPGPFARTRAFAAMLDGIAARVGRSVRAAADGQAEAAVADLAPLRRDWIVMRREAGLYGLPECLDEASDALEAFQLFRRSPPDLGRAEVRADIIGKAAVYRFSLSRCDIFAVMEGVVDIEYRRQVDAAYAALDVVASAIRLRDPALLDRILADLKSLDSGLLLRFG